jgi:hypothetical protein
MKKFERLLLSTFHGFNGKDTILGNKVGNITEFDQECAICGLLYLNLLDEKKRCEYVPKTKRQAEFPFNWKNDLKIIIKCDFNAKFCSIEGDEILEIKQTFPRYQWTKNTKGDCVMIINRDNSLQSNESTAKDFIRGFLNLLV